MGIKGVQLFEELLIQNGTIVLRGKGYTLDDAMCCPSEAVIVAYVLVDRELVARGSKP